MIFQKFYKVIIHCREKGTLLLHLGKHSWTKQIFFPSTLLKGGGSKVKARLNNVKTKPMFWFWRTSLRGDIKSLWSRKLSVSNWGCCEDVTKMGPSWKVAKSAKISTIDAQLLVILDFCQFLYFWSKKC